MQDLDLIDLEDDLEDQTFNRLVLRAADLALETQPCH